MALTTTASNSMTIVEAGGTTTGASDPITSNGARYIDVAANFSTGSFSGQVDLEGEYRVGASNVYAWQAIESYTSDTVKVARVASSRRLRFNVSTNASGTFRGALTVGNQGG